MRCAGSTPTPRPASRSSGPASATPGPTTPLGAGRLARPRLRPPRRPPARWHPGRDCELATVKADGPDGGCLEIGALLFPEHRGHGLGTAAQRLLVEYLFATTLANRLQAITDVENLAEQRVLERIGFRREGVMRGLAFIGGRWRNGVLYARLRDDTPG
jgi:RimJ/RimL family protein N-acetyltransferase